MESQADYRLYTDGSAVPNPGRGGWAVVWTRNDALLRVATGSAAETTNNRMELQALIEALSMLPDQTEACIFSDSQLAVRTVNEWGPAWRSRGWTRKRGSIANLDLVRQVVKLADERPRCRIEWVRGHAGNRWNEHADEMANRARLQGEQSQC